VPSSHDPLQELHDEQWRRHEDEEAERIVREDRIAEYTPAPVINERHKAQQAAA
jgi:hypothetical protein